MNRKQRRQLKKQGIQVAPDPVFNMKQSDIDKMKQKEQSNAVDTAMVLLLGLPIKVLHDKYGWRNKKRLPEFAEALTDLYQEFSDGELDLNEFAEMIYQETGIKFQKG